MRSADTRTHIFILTRHVLYINIKALNLTMNRSLDRYQAWFVNGTIIMHLTWLASSRRHI